MYVNLIALIPVVGPRVLQKGGDECNTDKIQSQFQQPKLRYNVINNMYAFTNTREYQIGKNIKPLDPKSVASVVRYGEMNSSLNHEAKGDSLIYSQLYPYEGLRNYTSGIIHHVRLTDATHLFVQFHLLSFRTMPVSGPTSYPKKIAVLGDLVGDVITDPTTGLVADFACEVEITECEPLPDGRFFLEAMAKCSNPIPCSTFNNDGSIYAYAVCYDWSKGAENHNPSTAKTCIYLHTTQESEVKSKPRVTTGGRR
ncbi:hypothetical protein POM88_001429 [Heracleum sosnowskyi]|uniref:Uncharacterized protein n=1 Tax=Heracleum sosnowskyi TaxID=360622 RepID=A0AAD8N9M9_9APIA|nr:hypothetical protein POM88_001429 [Heracleum sosnowskyi]